MNNTCDRLARQVLPSEDFARFEQLPLKSKLTAIMFMAWIADEEEAYHNAKLALKTLELTEDRGAAA